MKFLSKINLFDRDRMLEILQVFLTNPFRTFLSGLGVGWGLFMIVVTVGASNGLENGVTSDMGGRVKNSMFVWTQWTAKPYKGFKRGRSFNFNSSDTEYLRENSTSATLIAPRNQLGGHRGSNNIMRGTKSGAFNVYGDIPGYIEIDPVKIISGRYLNDGDLDQERKVAVIGKRVLELLYEQGEEPIGSSIRVQGVLFTVVGVYSTYKTGEDAEEGNQSIFVPYTTFGKAFHTGDKVGWYGILIDKEIHADSAANEIIGLMKQRKSVHPDDKRAFGHWTMASAFEEIETIFAAFRLISFIFGGLALLAGAIGIMNIMLITVRERTQELGIRRAMGATPFTVMRQIMAETMFLTTLSGLAGVSLGVASLEVVNDLLKSMDGASGSFRNPEVSLNIVLIALGVMLVMGLIAGILPALRAVAVRPVEAIRTE
ncbi:MAG: multidrug ABC transporter ATP-binding protein [Bacteroidetes bacterium]|nr:MAG: multidrug ABC transporter ATP-binding protein [Bacteroidota bacterium]